MFLASARANARISIARLRANIEPLCGISIAPRAQISIYKISPHPPSPRRRSPAPRRSRPLFVTPKACHLSRYRESLPHKARQSRAGEGRFYLSTFNFQFEKMSLFTALRTKCAAMRPKKFPAGRNEAKNTRGKTKMMCVLIIL